MILILRGRLVIFRLWMLSRSKTVIPMQTVEFVYYQFDKSIYRYIRIYLFFNWKQTAWICWLHSRLKNCCLHICSGNLTLSLFLIHIASTHIPYCVLERIWLKFSMSFCANLVKSIKWFGVGITALLPIVYLSEFDLLLAVV